MTKLLTATALATLGLASSNAFAEVRVRWSDHGIPPYERAVCEVANGKSTTYLDSVFACVQARAAGELERWRERAAAARARRAPEPVAAARGRDRSGERR